MKRWQLIALAVLIFVPVLTFTGFAAWALFQIGWLRYIGWIIPVSWSVAYFLARNWRADAAATLDEQAASHWTARDEAAWKVVLARAKASPDVTPDRLLDPHYYLNAAQQLGLEVARHYHGEQADSLGRLTVPEVLAAAELALHDTGDWMRRYVPGSHLVRIDHWRSLAKTPHWWRLGNRLWRLGTLVLDPTAIFRQLAAQVTVDAMSRELQAGFLAVFHSIFLQRIGYYLIEMNSGRLRLGADAYRKRKSELLGNEPGPRATSWWDDFLGASPTAAAESAPPNTDADRHDDSAPGTAAPNATNNEPPPASVVLCLTGQVNAGKSSLCNALLGSQQALTDALPATRDIRRYRLRVPGAPTELVLLDTPGYGEQGPSPADVDQLVTALVDSDALILVMDVTHPARRAEVELLAMMRKYYAEHPERKPPPIVGVLTHIDGLRPVLEWTPPYDWRNPQRPKEKSIRDAVEFNREQLGEQVAAVIPACTDGARGRVSGVQEDVLPALLDCLPRARACALLRSLHREWDDTRIQQVVDQVKQVGAAVWRLIRG